MVKKKILEDLDDILQEMKSRDASGEWQPLCVAVEYSNFPHSEDGAIPNSQIHGTLLNMRKDLVTKDTLNSFKTEVMSALKILSNLIVRPAGPSSPYMSPRRVISLPPSHSMIGKKVEVSLRLFDIFERNRVFIFL